MVDNFFIARDFDWEARRLSHLDRAINVIARRLGTRIYTAPIIDRLILALTGFKFSATWSGSSTNLEQRMNIYHLASQVLAYEVEGDLVEVGCNEGQSSILIRTVMNDFKSQKAFHVYDSFSGLPDTRTEDGTSYKAGDLAVSEAVFRKNFADRGLSVPIIHKGWFSDTLTTGLPDRICFAYLDGDLYDSIMVSLEHTYPRLSKGAICLIDDYCDTAVDPHGWNQLPGVKKACDAFLADKPEKVCYLYSGSYTHGFFRKL